MYPLGLVTRVLVVATILLCSIRSATPTPGIRKDGTDGSPFDQMAQIIEQLKQKVGLEATKGALLRIKSEYADFKQETTDQLIEFDRLNGGYTLFTDNEPKQSKIVKQISKQLDNFEKVFKAERDTALKNIDEVRLKGYRESQQYGIARMALDELKPKFERFKWDVAHPLSQVTKQTRGDLSELINERTKEFNEVLRTQLAKAFDSIAH